MCPTNLTNTVSFQTTAETIANIFLMRRMGLSAIAGLSCFLVMVGTKNPMKLRSNEVFTIRHLINLQTQHITE